MSGGGGCEFNDGLCNCGQESWVESSACGGGMSVKIESGEQPVDGFMVARKERSRIVTAEDFYDET